MKTKDMLQSIGDKVAAIDLKLERLLNDGDEASKAHLEQSKRFLEDISRTLATKLAGDFPGAIENLEKKIDSFDLNLSDSLKIFSNHLLSYEHKLEERVVKEIEDLGGRLIERLDQQQQAHADRLENLSRSMDNLSRAIAGLAGNGRSQFDPQQLNRTLENLGKLIEDSHQGKQSFAGFWGRKKTTSE